MANKTEKREPTYAELRAENEALRKVIQDAIDTMSSPYATSVRDLIDRLRESLNTHVVGDFRIIVDDKALPDRVGIRTQKGRTVYFRWEDLAELAKKAKGE